MDNYSIKFLNNKNFDCTSDKNYFLNIEEISKYLKKF